MMTLIEIISMTRLIV